MSPTIRIDEEVFKALQQKAQPFVDSPNDALRRLLGLNHSRPQAVRPSRAPAGSATPERSYRPLILRTLAEAGGRAARQDVLASIEREMDGRFKPRDLERYPSSGALVWQTYASYEGTNMRKDGLLVKGPPRGFWHLTERGQEEAQRQP